MNSKLLYAVGGAALLQLLARRMGASSSKAEDSVNETASSVKLSGGETAIPDFAMPFVDIVGTSVIAKLCKDATWLELCDRAGDFALIAKPEFAALLVDVADVVDFPAASASIGVSKRARPRMYRACLHRIVEGVRNMRATIEADHPESLEAFDEIAADFQRTHDDYALNVLLESRS